VTGLDYHTGFISCENGEVWFINSSASGVIKELAVNSTPIIYNHYGVIGCLSSDIALLKKWLYNNN